MKKRVGFGYDIHRLVEGRKLFIGGVEIPYVRGLLGHSDADVLLHAICDALLGASGLGDIGEHFPDTDKKYLNISSLELLRQLKALLKANNYSIDNIDAVVVIQEPSLKEFKPLMKKVISEALGVDASCINIKAKTNEGLGDIGASRAVSAYAAAIVSGKGD